MSHVNARSLVGTSVIALAASLLLMAGAAPAEPVRLSHCYSSDNGSPVLKGLTLSPSTVEVSAGPEVVTITAQASDAGGPGAATGIRSVSVVVVDDSFIGLTELELKPSESGYVGAVTIPRGTGGPLHIGAVFLRDRVHNDISYSYDELGGLGGDRDITITSPFIPDEVPPTLHSLSLSPTAVNTTVKAKTVTVTAQVTDELTGVASVSVFAYRGEAFADATLDRVTDDTYRGELRIGTWLGSGTWRLEVHLADNRGNTRTYYETDLAAAGAGSTFDVVSNTDLREPRMTGFDRRPAFVDVRRTARALYFRVRARDAKSGVATITVDLRGVARGHVVLHRISGNARDGTYVGKVKLTPCAVRRSGLASFTIWVEDRAGNVAYNSSLTLSPHRWVRIKAISRARPKAFLAKAPRPSGPVSLDFNKDVTGINKLDAVVVPVADLEQRHFGAPTPGTWTCTNRYRAPARCATGHVRHARFKPIAPFPPGRWAVVLNPAGTLGITDFAGNPFDRTVRSFYIP